MQRSTFSHHSVYSCYKMSHKPVCQRTCSLLVVRLYILLHIIQSGLAQMVDQQGPMEQQQFNRQHGQFQKWADRFSSAITKRFSDATGLVDIAGKFKNGTEILLDSPRVEARNGEALLQEIRQSMEEMLQEKVGAIRDLVTKAEEAHANHTDEPNIQVDYPNSKNLSDSFVLEQDPHFYNIPVNTQQSSVHVPTNVYDQASDILNGVKWSEQLDEKFAANYDEDPTLSWQYFCSVDGFFRNYPGIKWPESKVDMYDCRARGWYIQAATSPKDVVILVDSSGSMKGQRMEIAKATVEKILDTLSDNDFFNIIKFSEEPEYADTCFNRSMIQANSHNKQRMKEQLKDLETRAIAVFDKALTEAFELLKETRENDQASMCNRAIMLITDGAPDNYEEIYSQYNWPNKTIRVFTYLIGREVSDSKQVLWAACANKGYFSHISTLADVQEHVQNYINVMNRPLQYSCNDTACYSEANAEGGDGESEPRNATHYRIWSDSVAWDPRGLKLMTSLAQPVYDTKNETIHKGKLVGVVGTDIPLSELQKIAPKYKLGVNGYAFAITNNGHVLFHPQFKPLDGDVIKPNFNSVDLSEVEIQMVSQNVDDIYYQELELRRRMIARETGSLQMAVKVPYDDMKRVASRTYTYYFTPISGTPFSLGLALPSEYGEYELIGKTALSTVGLREKIVSYDNVKLAPWEYCKLNATEAMEDHWEVIRRYLLKGQKPADHPEHQEYIDKCDEDLIEHLLFDIETTDSSLTSWMKQRRDMTKNEAVSKNHGIEWVFLGTKAGVTRYHHFFDVQNLTDPDFLEDKLDTIDSLYYKRAVEGGDDVFTISVPFNAGKEMNVTEEAMVTIVTPLMVSSSDTTVRPRTGGSDPTAVAAVLGMQMRYRNFQEHFINITSICDGDENCLTCADEESVNCYLIDNNGFIVYSPRMEEIGTFLGDHDGTLMRELFMGDDENMGSNRGVFQRVSMFDYQGVCEIYATKGSGAASLFVDPLRHMISGVSWFFNEFILLLLHFNFWNLWHYDLFGAAAQNETVHDIIDKIIFYIEDQVHPDEQEVVKESLFKDFDYRNIEVVRNFYTEIQNRYKIKIIGREPCTKDWWAYDRSGNLVKDLPATAQFQSCYTCVRLYSIHQVARTNLMLLITNACLCMDDGPYKVEQKRVEYTETAMCQKLKRELSRMRPRTCYSSHPLEDSSECGGSSGLLALNHLLLMAMSILPVILIH